MRNKIYVPFSKESKFWLNGYNTIFTNKINENQDKRGILSYSVLPIVEKYVGQKRMDYIESLTKRIVIQLGLFIGEYAHIEQNSEFWNGFLQRWVRIFVCNTLLKIEQIDCLLNNTSEYDIITNAPKEWNLMPKKFIDMWEKDSELTEESYNVFSNLYLASKYLNITILCDSNMTFSAFDNTFSTKNNSKRLLDRFRAVKLVKIIKKLKGKYIYYKRRNKEIISIYNVPIFSDTLEKWYYQSNGRITSLYIEEPRHTYNMDIYAREKLGGILETIALNQEERAIMALLPHVIPKFFVEKFRDNYRAVEKYLHQHSRLKIVYTQTGSLASSLEQMCMLLLKQRGGKIIGQQHGGNYQIESYCDKSEEFYIDDYFYYWGKGGADLQRSDCQVRYAPTYNLAKYDKIEKIPRYDQILFCGTAIREYPANGKTLAEHNRIIEQYLTNKISFLSHINKETKKKILIREYYIDYGWHIVDIIKRNIPDIKFDGTVSVKNNFFQADTVKRSLTFSESLASSALFVVDHLSTTWLEALYFGVPFIVVLTKDFMSIRESEKEYFSMMKKVDILFDDPILAANKVNEIVNNPLNWWLECERQNVINIIKDRWITNCNDIDEWWYRELMSKAGEK